jgi:peptidoglycan/xylan/chitin deacetylase (PgdA/CDA1 family)
MNNIMAFVSRVYAHCTLLIRLSVLLHVVALLCLLLRPDLWPWPLAVVAGNHLLIALTGLWPRSHWLGPNWTQLPAAAATRNEIALTIDDGPDPLVTPQVLDLLDQFAAKATFFCIGNRALQYPELCRDIIRRGHCIENHSQQHRHYFSLLGPNGCRREITAAQHTIASITGVSPQFFRAPAGLRNPFLQAVLSSLGLRLASWSVRGFDTRISDASKVTATLLRGLRPGAILLLHDGNAARNADNIPVILTVLPLLLAAANQAELHFVTLVQAAK